MQRELIPEKMNLKQLVLVDINIKENQLVQVDINIKENQVNINIEEDFNIIFFLGCKKICLCIMINVSEMYDDK